MDIIYLAVALAMDAFALSLAIGCAYKDTNYKSVALQGALIFGLCQGLLFLAGAFLGNIIKAFMMNMITGVAFVLLIFIAIKMLLEFKQEEESGYQVSTKGLIYIGILTAVDAFAAGIASTVYESNIFVMSFIIGITTFIICTIGFILAKKLRKIDFLEKYSLLFSAFILIFLAIKLIA